MSRFTDNEDTWAWVGQHVRGLFLQKIVDSHAISSLTFAILSRCIEFAEAPMIHLQFEIVHCFKHLKFPNT